MIKEMNKGCDIVPQSLRKWLHKQGIGVQEISPPNQLSDQHPDPKSERVSVDTSFIKERHGYADMPLNLDELLALRDSKNSEYVSGSAELQRDSHKFRAVEIIKQKDFDSLHTKTGHIDFEDYLASKYAVINIILGAYGIEAEVSRVIVIEDDVDIEAAGFPTPWHAGWLEHGFLDSNGAHGVWHISDENGEFDPTRDGRWDTDLMTSMDDIHEWFHLVAHIPHTYESDAWLQNGNHPALVGVSEAWHQFYDRYRWEEDLMNGGVALDVSEPLDTLIRRRVDEGWMHDDARCIPETNGYPNETPERVLLNFGKEWAGAHVEIFKVISSDGTYLDTSKVLASEAFLSGTTATEEDEELKVGDIDIGNPYDDPAMILSENNGQQILDAKQTLMFVRVEKDGKHGWVYISWGDLFLAGDVDRERLNIRLATPESPDPEDFDFSVTYGDVPDEPDGYTIFLPIVNN